MQVQLCTTSGALDIATLPWSPSMSPRGIFNKAHPSVSPCSDLGQGVSMIITAFMLPRLFAHYPFLPGHRRGRRCRLCGLLLAPEWGLVAHVGFPWAGVRASRYPVHPGRRPTSPPATSGAVPCLSTAFWLWALPCAPTGCSLHFSSLFLCSFCLCV